MASTSDSAAKGSDAASSGGLPQLDFSTFDNQIFWLLVALVATFFILSKVALPRIAAILADRQDAITGDLARAEELNQKAKKAEAAYEQALIDARANAAAIIKETKVKIDEDLQAAIAKADIEISKKSDAAEEQIEQIKASALEGIRSVSTDIAGEIASQVGVKVDSAAIGKSIEDQLKG